MLKLLLSFDGRISRKHFWLGEVLSIALLAPALAGVLAAYFWPQSFEVTEVRSTLGHATEPVIAIVVLLMFFSMFAFIVAQFALGVKRYHDIGKAGAWVLISFLPGIGPFWYWIEAGCRPGTRGANNFGERSA